MKSDDDARQLDLDWILPDQLAVLACPDEGDLPALASLGVRVLISLNEYPPPTVSVQRAGMRHVLRSFPNGTAPPMHCVRELVGVIRDALNRGETVAVHCAAGKGRSGTIAACYLVSCGYSPRDAIEFVRSRRRGAIENEHQERAVLNWWRELHGWQTARWL